MAQVSAEKLEHTGPTEKERVASLASTSEPPLPKGKGTEPSDHEGERVKVGENCTSARKGGLKLKHEEERVDSTVNEGRFQGGQGGQARTVSLGEVEGSMSG